MSIQMPSSVAFPQGVKYNSMLPQAVAQGKVATRKYYATNSNSNFSFASTNEIRIDISADRNTFLNTAQGYLEFNLGVQGQTLVSLDGSAASWIQQLRIQSLGGDIELISNYNLLFTILLQYTSSVSSLVSSNALMGSYRGVNMMPRFETGPSVTTELTSNVFTMDNATAGVGLVNFESSGGRCNINPFDCESIVAASSKTFCIPLVSGFLGGDTYLPMSGKGFTIILNLAQNELLGKWDASVGTYTISNISYNVPVISITDPQFNQAFEEMFRDQKRISFYGQTYKNYVSSVIGSGGQQSVIINDRSKSLNAILCCLRANNVAIPAFNRLALSCRSISQVASFQCRIGDLLFPNQQIDIVANGVSAGQIDGGRAEVQYRGLGADQPNLNITRAMAEVMKSFRSLHSSLGTGCVSCDNYASDEGLSLTGATSNLPTGSATVTANLLSHHGMGLLGLDFSTYSGDDSNVSGIDTASNNLNVTLLFNFQTLVGASYETQTFCVCDAIYSLNYDGSYSANY